MPKRVSLVILLISLLVLFSASAVLAVMLVWHPVVAPGAGGGSGFGILANSYTGSMALFNGNMYVGTGNVDGAQVWRYDGTNWAQVVGGGSGANGPGFGNANNYAVFSMTVFGGNLYAGTANEATGSEVWRTSDGTTWEEVGTAGLGDFDNTVITSLVAFNSNLYAGTYNTVDGSRVYQFVSPGTWNAANTAGFGEGAVNYALWSMNTFNGSLYAAVDSLAGAGAKVFRYDGGTNWTKVNTDGFGSDFNSAALELVVFGGHLYCSTTNPNGAEIWRYDGSSWTQVATAGFGDSTNIGVFAMSTFGSHLYAATYSSSGAIIVGSAGHTVLSRSAFDVLNGAQPGPGTQVWRSSDGMSWELTNTPGFGDPSNYVTVRMLVFGDSLYAGTETNSGLQIWRTQGEVLRELPPTGGEGSVGSQPSLLLWLTLLSGLTLSLGGLVLIRKRVL